MNGTTSKHEPPAFGLTPVELAVAEGRFPRVMKIRAHRHPAKRPSNASRVLSGARRQVRGPRELIRSRLRIYLPFIEP
jgi:hypothetical protein